MYVGHLRLRDFESTATPDVRSQFAFRLVSSRAWNIVRIARPGPLSSYRRSGNQRQLAAASAGEPLQEARQHVAARPVGPFTAMAWSN